MLNPALRLQLLEEGQELRKTRNGLSRIGFQAIERDPFRREIKMFTFHIGALGSADAGQPHELDHISSGVSLGIEFLRANLADDRLELLPVGGCPNRCLDPQPLESRRRRCGDNPQLNQNFTFCAIA